MNTEGELFDYENWNNGEPNGDFNGVFDEDYVEVYSLNSLSPNLINCLGSFLKSKAFILQFVSSQI